MALSRLCVDLSKPPRRVRRAPARIEPTLDIVRRHLRYDPNTGNFIRLVAGGGSSAGSVAGYLMQTGYWTVTVANTKCLAHRLAWFYMTGEWPTFDIDHRDRCKTNNRWSNLREARASENGANAPRSKNNTSGFKGVTLCKSTGRWAAQIMKDRRHIHIGYFDSPEAAHMAYHTKAAEIFGEFARSA